MKEYPDDIARTAERKANIIMVIHQPTDKSDGSIATATKLRDKVVAVIADTLDAERNRCAEIADDCPLVIDTRLCPGSEQSAYIMGWDAAVREIHTAILKGEDS